MVMFNGRSGVPASMRAISARDAAVSWPAPMCCAAAMRVAGHHPCAERFGRRPPRGVPLQVRQHFAIRVDDLANELRARDRLFQFAGRAGAGGDQQLEIELVRIHHQANHGLLVVGIPADVRQDGKARPLRGAEHGERHVESGGAEDAGEAEHDRASPR